MPSRAVNLQNSDARPHFSEKSPHVARDGAVFSKLLRELIDVGAVGSALENGLRMRVREIKRGSEREKGERQEGRGTERQCGERRCRVASNYHRG